MQRAWLRARPWAVGVVAEEAADATLALPLQAWGSVRRLEPCRSPPNPYPFDSGVCACSPICFLGANETPLLCSGCCCGVVCLHTTVCVYGTCSSTPYLPSLYPPRHVFPVPNK